MKITDERWFDREACPLVREPAKPGTNNHSRQKKAEEAIRINRTFDG